MPIYNEIEDSKNEYVLWKNENHTSAGNIAFKNIFIEWGMGPDKRIRIRRIIYPKKFYNILDVMKIAEITENCPFCKTGQDLSKSSSLGLDKYLNNGNDFKKGRETSMLQNAFSKVSDTVNGMGRKVFGSAAKNVVPQLVAKAPQYITGYIGSNLGRKAINGAIGIAGLIALQKGKLSGIKGDAGEIFFGDFLADILRTEQGAMFGMKNDLAKLKNAVSFGDGKGMMDAFINREVFQNMKMPSFGISNMLTKLKLGTFGTPLLEAAKTTIKPNTARIPPKTSSFGFPMRFNKI